jgi:autotransporter-associated beta strand protein
MPDRFDGRWCSFLHGCAGCRAAYLANAASATAGWEAGSTRSARMAKRRFGSMMATASSLALLLPAIGLLAPTPLHAQTWTGPGTDYNTATNWSTTTAPTGAGQIATFTDTGPTSVNVSANVDLGGFTFNAGAQAYTIGTSGALVDLLAAGVTNNSSNVQNFNASAGAFQFAGSSTAGTSTIYTASTGGQIEFFQTSSGGSAQINLSSGALLVVALSSGGLSIGSLAGTGGAVEFSPVSGGATTQSLTVGSLNTSTTFAGAIIEGGATGSLTKVGTGTLTLTGNNSYQGGTNLNAGTIAVGSNTALGTGALTMADGTTLQAAANVSLSNAIELDGTNSIDTNGNALTLAGTISGTGVTLDKIGTGTLILSGTNTYTGATTVNGGTLEVDGRLAASSGVTVNADGTLDGTGVVGATTINNGGTFMPGNVTPGSSMTVTGSLALQSGALFMVQINPATASFANVTGTAYLGGATVGAIFAAGSYVSKQYTLVQATGIVSGTFNPAVANTNLPSNFHTTLSYDTHDAYLNLALNFGIPGGLNGNQQNVGNALTSFFNATGGIPLVFGALTPAALTQASGEIATGSQQTTFDAMNMFMGAMTDPFIDGRGDPVPAGSSAGASAYAAPDNPRSGAARDANAMFTKAPVMADPFAPRWSVWSAGYGGSQTTDGNAAAGSNATTSAIYGTVVGADYRFSPSTLAGFALAGGGTNFSVNGSGSGRSDLFQAGAFIRHTVGPAYISAALAYGWQDITTDRTVTIAGVDQLRAEFNANAWSGRVEGGYRFVSPWMGGIGITPYAAGQFTTFDLPAYAEQAVTGTNTFALAYGAQSVTDPRSELGIRTDKSFAMPDGILTLRGGVAWAHDFDPDRSIGATFQTLPGASFVVNGAAQASDSALVTASAEKKWLNGWSAAATFEGEFSNVTNSYAGKGVLRYSF